MVLVSFWRYPDPDPKHWFRLWSMSITSSLAHSLIPSPIPSLEYPADRRRRISAGYPADEI